MKKTLSFVVAVLLITAIAVCGVLAYDDLPENTFSCTTLPANVEQFTSRGNVSWSLDEACGDSYIVHTGFENGTPGMGEQGPDNLWSDEGKYCIIYEEIFSNGSTNKDLYSQAAVLSDPVHVTGFVIKTGDDNVDFTGRNPLNWAIWGETENNVWKCIAAGTSDFLEDYNYAYYSASIDKTSDAFVRFRFEIGESENGEVMQLGGVFILTDADLLPYNTFSCTPLPDDVLLFNTKGNESSTLDNACGNSYPVFTNYEGGTLGNGGEEGSENLWIDGGKYCLCYEDFYVNGSTNKDLFAQASVLGNPVHVTGFVIKTGNDNIDYTGRNPLNWAIWGETEDNEWICLAAGTSDFLEDKNDTYYSATIARTDDAFIRFRFEMSDSVNGESVQIGGVFMLTDVNSKPVSVYNKVTGTCFGDECFDYGREYDKAFDGSFASFYDASEFGSHMHIGIKNTNPVFLKDILLLPRQTYDGNVAERMNGINIQASLDGKTWITLYTLKTESDEYAGLENGLGWWHITYDMLDEKVRDYAYNYFAISNGREHLNMAEVEFYGETASSAPEAVYKTISRNEYLTSDHEYIGEIGYLNEYGELCQEEGERLYWPDGSVFIADATFSSNITNYVLPCTIDGHNVIGIMNGVFEGSGIETFSCSDGSDLSYIEYGAFADCKELTTVNLTGYVLYVRGGAFIGCDSLEAINTGYHDVEQWANSYKRASSWGNAFIISFDGVLYWGDADCENEGYRIITYPAARQGSEYTNKDGVGEIEGYAFYGAKNLTSINLTNSVRNIIYSAFEGCESLMTIRLGSNISIVEGRAFALCPNLTTITILANPENDFGSYFDLRTDYRAENYEGWLEWLANENIFADHGNLEVIGYENTPVQAYVETLQNVLGDDIIKFTATDEVVWSYSFDDSDISYDLNDDEVIVTGFSAPTDARITTIPETVGINGKIYKVAGITPGALTGDQICGDFKFPDTVKFLRAYSISSPNVTSITLPKYIESCYIDYGFCCDCLNLEKFIIPPTITDMFTEYDGAVLYMIEDMNGDWEHSLLVSCAPGCGLENLKVNESCLYIENEAFKNVTTLESVSFPITLANVGAWCFENDTSLTSLIFPEGVRFFDIEAFLNSSITDIYFNGIVEGYDRWDGVSCIYDYGYTHDNWGNEIFPIRNNLTVHVLEGTPAASDFTYLHDYDCERWGTENCWNLSVEPCEETRFATVYSPTYGNDLYAIFPGTDDTDIDGRYSITIPDNIDTIDADVHEYNIENGSIKKLVIPDSVSRIWNNDDYGSFLGKMAENAEIIFESPRPIEYNSEMVFGYEVDQFADAVEFTINGLIYRALGTEAEVIGCEPTANIVIPEAVSYDGNTYTVISIGEKALSPLKFGEGGEIIESIEIPETVTHIGYTAFAHNVQLKSITFPSAVKEIDYDITSWCTSLEHIYGLDDYYDETSANRFRVYTDNAGGGGQAVIDTKGHMAVLYTAGSSATQFTLPDDGSIAAIKNWAFCGAQNLKIVTIPEGCTIIGIGAFNSCSSLQKIIIPSTVSMIQDDVFTCCDSLYDISISKLNKNLEIVDGAVYRLVSEDDDKYYVLSFYPAGLENGSCTVPDDINGIPVKEIQTQAFKFNRKIESITVGRNVEYIGAFAFEIDDSLTSLVINAENCVMNQKAIANMAELHYIEFNGDILRLECEEDWKYSTEDWEGYNTGIKRDYNDDYTTFISDGTVILETRYDDDAPNDELRVFTWVEYRAAIIDEAFDGDRLVIGSAFGTNNGILDLSSYNFTTITSGAFYGRDDIKTVILPSTCTTIEAEAFRCAGLTSFTIPAQLENLEGMFCELYDLVSLTVASGNQWYKVVDGCLYSMDGTVLYYVPLGLEQNGFTIPSGVTRVADYAMFACRKISGTVSIPASVTEIGYVAFSYMNSLEAFEMTAPNNDNGYYHTDSYGVLYANDSYSFEDNNITGSKLMHYPLGSKADSVVIDCVIVGQDALNEAVNLRSISTSMNVKALDLNAFCNCENIFYLSLDNVTLAGPGAFANCVNLKTVSLKNARVIGDCAFANCTSLNSITLGDTVPYIYGTPFVNCDDATIYYAPSAEWDSRVVNGLIEIEEERYLKAVEVIPVQTDGDLDVDCSPNAYSEPISINCETGDSTDSSQTYEIETTTDNNEKVTELDNPVYIKFPIDGENNDVDDYDVTYVHGGVTKEVDPSHLSVVDIDGDQYVVAEISEFSTYTVTKKSAVKTIGFNDTPVNISIRVPGFTNVGTDEERSVQVISSSSAIKSFTINLTSEKKTGTGSLKTGFSGTISDGNVHNVKAVSQFVLGSYKPVVTAEDKDGNKFRNITVTIIGTGDTDEDGTVSSEDAVKLARYIAGYNIEVDTVTSDVDSDGAITPRDSMILARKLAGWSGYEKLPYVEKSK